MSRAPSRAGALVALACLPLALASQPATDAAERPLRMDVVGDSLAFGTGATDPANGMAFRIYRTLLASRPGSEVTNHAIGGSRVADVARPQVAEIAPDADLVFVLVGGNDVVRETPRRRFAADAMLLLEAVRRRVPRAALVVCGVPDVARSPLFADTKNKTEALSRADDAAMRAAAARVGATFVDLFAFTSREGRTPSFSLLTTSTRATPATNVSPASPRRRSSAPSRRAPHRVANQPLWNISRSGYAARPNDDVRWPRPQPSSPATVPTSWSNRRNPS